MGTHFAAPWSKPVWIVTGLVVAVLVVVSAIQGGGAPWVAAGVIALCAVFAVRGYSVTGSEVLIHHLGWAKRLPLADVERVEASPGVMTGSVRVFGIGGVFGSYGWFRNAVLGSYTSYATDPARAVVLKVGQKTLVVTPDDPAGFVAAVERGKA